jgi:hypothetical protein
MISIHLKGGLGNQMFQIAAALAEAYRNNDNACFDLDTRVYKGQGNNPSFYKENVFSKLCDLPGTNCRYMNDGYYQSEKYFIEYKDKIIDVFTNMEIVNNLINKYPLNNSLSVHVRRGDYLGLQHYHPCPSMEYYQQVLSLIEADNILVFSDDIEWCKKNFKNVIFVEGQKDYEDLYLMSLCKHHIIANSSFSWWGAYLSRDENVIAPKLWFGYGGPQNWQDIYCKNWTIC